MESDAERGVGSSENDGEELPPVLTITSLNRVMIIRVYIKALSPVSQKEGKVIQRCVPDAQAQRLDAILSMDCPVWAAVGGQVPPWRMVLPVAAASRPQLY